MNADQIVPTLERLDWGPIRDILRDCCISLRLAEQVTVDGGGSTHIWFMPNIDEVPGDGIAKVHLTLLAMGIDEAKAEENRDSLIRLLEPASEAFAEGPSYIHIGYAIGSQDLAMALIAIGRHLGLWNILSPQTMGIDDPTLAERMAGAGMINAHGWNPDGDAKWDASLLDVPQPEVEADAE